MALGAMGKVGTSMIAVADIIEKLEVLLENTRSLTSKVSTAVDGACAGIESMMESEISQNKKVRDAYQDLKTTAESASLLVNEVDYIIQIGHNEERTLTIRNGLAKQTTHRKRFWCLRRFFKCSYTYVTPTPDYRYLKEFIDQVRRAMARIEQVYVEFKKRIDNAIKTTNDAAEDCRSLAREARLKKGKVAVKGGITTLTTTVASTLVGGPVGLVASALGAVVGVGGTMILVVKFERLATAFEVQYTILNDWASCVNQLKDSAVNVHHAFDKLAAVVDDLEHGQQNQESIETLCQNLGLLNESFTKVSDESQNCRTEIQSAKETMESGLAKIT